LPPASARPPDWPLPTGLGGAIGDSMIFIPSLLLGSTANASRILMGLLFGMPTDFSCSAWRSARASRKCRSRRRSQKADEEEDGVRASLLSRVSAAFGSVFHFFYVVRARLAGRRPPKEKRSWRERLAAFLAQASPNSGS
jgi:S-DNA-T family DNA segregation ATPase FtsK/SpoIIIE